MAITERASSGSRSRWTARVACVLVLLSAIYLLALGCSASSSSDPASTATRSFPDILDLVATVAEAEAELGATLVVPTYVTPGLKRVEVPTLIREGGDVTAVSITYTSRSTNGDNGPVVSAVILLQWKDPKYASEPAGEPVTIGGVGATLSRTFGLNDREVATVQWRVNGQAFEAFVTGSDDVEYSVVREEALKIVESMIGSTP